MIAASRVAIVSSSMAKCSCLASRSEAELAVQLGRGISSDPDVELFRFDDPFFLCRAPKLQFVRSQFEMHGFGCASGDVYSLETLQLTYWTRSAAGPLVNVELDHGIAGTVTGVGYVDRNV